MTAKYSFDIANDIAIDIASFDIAVTLKVIPEFQGDPKNLNNFLMQLKREN